MGRKRNWMPVLKNIRAILISYPDSTLCQAKFITDFIRENFIPKKQGKGFQELPPKGKVRGV